MLAGIALFFFPEWFYQNIGNYPPYNRHYEGDLGTFQLAVGKACYLLHAFNHTYHSIADQATLAHWPIDTLPLFVFAGLLILAYYMSSG